MFLVHVRRPFGNAHPLANRLPPDNQIPTHTTSTCALHAANFEAIFCSVRSL